VIITWYCEAITWITMVLPFVMVSRSVRALKAEGSVAVRPITLPYAICYLGSFLCGCCNNHTRAPYTNLHSSSRQYVPGTYLNGYPAYKYQIGVPLKCLLIIIFFGFLSFPVVKSKLKAALFTSTFTFLVNFLRICSLFFTPCDLYLLLS